MSGSVSYHAGLAAEDQVARLYEKNGHVIVARRWRGAGGEIDLIAQKDGETIFVEVKKSVSHASAAAMLRPRQIERLFAAGSEYMGHLPDGQNAQVRFDVAIVDAQGQIDVIENALSA